MRDPEIWGTSWDLLPLNKGAGVCKLGQTRYQHLPCQLISFLGL